MRRRAYRTDGKVWPVYRMQYIPCLQIYQADCYHTSDPVPEMWRFDRPEKNEKRKKVLRMQHVSRVRLRFVEQTCWSYIKLIVFTLTTLGGHVGSPTLGGH